MLPVIENFAKLLKVMRNNTVEWDICKFLLVCLCFVLFCDIVDVE